MLNRGLASWLSMTAAACLSGAVGIMMDTSGGGCLVDNSMVDRGIDGRKRGDFDF